MAKSFLVIGLGRFGASTARTLTELGHHVMAVDDDMGRVDALKNDVLRCMQADATQESVVQKLGVSTYDSVVICIGTDLRTSILVTVLCHENGAKHIVAKAQDELQKKLLLKVGADRVILPELDAGMQLARTLVSANILDSLNVTERFSINEITVPEAWVGNTLAQLDVRRRYGLSVLALRRGEHVSVTLDPDAPFQAGDTLYVLGDNRSLEKLG